MTPEIRAALPSSRRGMLQGLAVLFSAANVAGAASTASPAPSLQSKILLAAPPPAQRLSAAERAALSAPLRTLLQTSPIAGFQYHCGEDCWALMRAGDPLSLVREPGNRFDERAVRLEWNGEKIGYVPARDNAAISQLLDRDDCLDAVITQLRESADPWDRVEFAVYLTIAV